MQDAPALFRLLGDEVRLRLLRVLHAERLNVTELTSILGIAQSGVSRHLGLLKDAGLVTEQREGGFTYFRPVPALSDARNGFGALGAMLEAHFDQATRTEVGRADDVRLAEVRRLRKENFEAHAGPDTHARQLVPGRSWAAWARALGHLLPALKVADLGCGEGYLTIETSRWASRVLAVDRSTTVLKRAQALAGRRRVRNVTWKRGELERLPIRDASVDVALLSQALHHARDPQKAISEAARIVIPGGRVLILDLREHGERWVRDRLGDRWLGFTDERLAALLEGAGLADVTVSVGARRTGEAFTVLVASGRKPAPGDTSGLQQARAGRRSKGGSRLQASAVSSCSAQLEGSRRRPFPCPPESRKPEARSLKPFQPH
jgi:ubiquinone/menaquinone biosynthesis C-methylase UbiE/DNA-binding transcriptional ArsR family regulator